MKTKSKVAIIPVILSDTEYAPEILEDGKMYISSEYGVALHNCLCGCGNKCVITIGKPTTWHIVIRDGLMSVTPSILNRICGAHYVITDNVANIL